MIEETRKLLIKLKKKKKKKAKKTPKKRMKLPVARWRTEAIAICSDTMLEYYNLCMINLCHYYKVEDPICRATSNSKRKDCVITQSIVKENNPIKFVKI